MKSWGGGRQIPANERPSAQFARFAARIIELEEIDGLGYFQPGTIEAITREHAKLSLPQYRTLESTRSALIREINAGSILMTENVDTFLDDYYSLSSEYKRIAAKAVGSLEDEIEQKLNDALMQGQPFGSFERTFQLLVEEDAEITARIANALARHDAKRDSILEANRVAADTIGRDAIPQVRSFRLPEIDLSVSRTSTMLENLSSRIRGASGAGGVGATVGAVISGIIVKKLVGKGILKVLATAASKVFVSKVASVGAVAAASGVIGGVIGSVVPGPGTAAGAVVGGVVGGLLVGVTVDAVLLKLEEAVSRANLRNEIVAAIKEHRLSMIASLNGTAVSE